MRIRRKGASKGTWIIRSDVAMSKGRVTRLADPTLCLLFHQARNFSDGPKNQHSVRIRPLPSALDVGGWCGVIARGAGRLSLMPSPGTRRPQCLKKDLKLSKETSRAGRAIDKATGFQNIELSRTDSQGPLSDASRRVRTAVAQHATDSDQVLKADA